MAACTTETVNRSRPGPITETPLLIKSALSHRTVPDPGTLTVSPREAVLPVHPEPPLTAQFTSNNELLAAVIVEAWAVELPMARSRTRKRVLMGRRRFLPRCWKAWHSDQVPELTDRVTTVTTLALVLVKWRMASSATATGSPCLRNVLFTGKALESVPT